MLRNLWCDAILFDNEGAGGAGDDSGNEQVSGETLSAEQLKAELEQVRKALKLANKEAGDRRKKLDEIEAAERERQDKELGEAESAKKKASEMEARFKAMADRHRKATISNAVRLAAATAEFADPDDAVALADLSGVMLDDETDKVTGAKEAVAALAKAKPHLIKQTGGGDINASARGRATAPSIDEIVAQKRASDPMYIPF